MKVADMELDAQSDLVRTIAERAGASYDGWEIAPSE
jgi:hypothetical protein